MESKLPFRNEVEKEMGIIEEEETSEEDNSSKGELDIDLVMAKPKTAKESSNALSNHQATYESGEITDIKSDLKINKLDVNQAISGNNKLAQDSSSLRKSFKEEETKNIKQ